MTLKKHFIFKIILLMMLSLKVSCFVYENVASLTTTAEFSFVLETDDAEKEETEERDEAVKILEETPSYTQNIFYSDFKYQSIYRLNYKILSLEFNPPPPEIS